MNNNIEIPKIHGKAEITLKNIKTGLVEKINSENTFQPIALQHFLQQSTSLTEETPFYSVNQNGSNPLRSILFSRPSGSSSSTPSEYTVWRSLIGGIFLFQNTISTGTEFMPASNKMIGCGCREYVNNTNVTEMGSYNIGDSEIDLNNGIITQTWDFNTSQANGTTRCISLTSMYGARMGYGNASGYGLTDTYTSGSNVDALVPLLRQEKGDFIFNNIGYVFDMPDTNTFRVRKYRKGINQLSIFQNGLIDTKTFDLISIGKGNMNFASYSDRLINFSFYYLGNGIFRFASTSHSDNTNVINEGQWYYYEYNTTNDSLILKSFTNETGETIKGGSDNYVFLRGNKILVSSNTTNYRYFLINLINNTIIKTFNENDYIYMYTVGNITNDENLITYCKNSDYNMRIYNIINDTSYITNEHWFGGSSSVPLLKRQWDENMYGYYGFEDYNFVNKTKVYKFFKEPRYLATINNLSTPIEKTSSHTLKVTYTLEEI